MNWDRIEGNWKQFKGRVMEQWGKLTGSHLKVIAGKREQLSGKVQKCYGVCRDEAEKESKEWESRYRQFVDRNDNVKH